MMLALTPIRAWAPIAARLEGSGPGDGFLRGHRQNANPEFNRIRSPWNLEIRPRMVVLYGYAGQHEPTVLGTTNRSDYLTGSFTKRGDGAGAAAVDAALVAHVATMIATSRHSRACAAEPDLVLDGPEHGP